MNKSLENKEITGFVIPQELSGLFHKHYDNIIIDESLTNLEALLLSLHLIEHNNNSAGAEYEDCKKFYSHFGREEDDFRKYVYQAKKESLIHDKNGKLMFLSKGLNKLNEITRQIGKIPVYILKSGANFTAIKLFEEFLENQTYGDEVLLCDSHISERSLFPFTVLKNKTKALKILTSNIYNEEKFNDYIKRMNKELNILVEAKINRKIHDRFIIFRDKCWIIGTSIKDLGNKDTIIKEISEIIHSMREIFYERWEEC